VAFSLGHPGLGPRRIAAMLARPQWGALVVSPNGVYTALRRHGLSTRAKRLGLLAGYRARMSRRASRRRAARHQHLSRRAGRPPLLLSAACTAPGAPSGSRPRSTPTAASLGRAGPLRRTRTRPGPDQPLRPACGAQLAPRRVAPGTRAHRQRERVRARLPRHDQRARRPPHPDPRRALADQRPRRTAAPHHPGRVLAPSVRALALPALPRVQRELDAYLKLYNHHRAHTGRITNGRCPAELVYGARKMEPR
jgi:hypothetical protein